MIPVQDVVPSGRLPLATIALLAANIGLFTLQSSSVSVDTASSPWRYGDIAHFLSAMLYLWLFGDNVEARLGRLTLVVIFALTGAVAVVVPTALGAPVAVTGLALSGAISGVVGAYFILLPHARVLLLVPTPAVIVEVPGMFFFAMWWVVQFLTYVVPPAAARLEFHTGAVMWGLAAAVTVGAAVAGIRRQPVRWT